MGGGRGLGTAPGSTTKSVGAMIFPEKPYLRPLSRKGQLAIMMRYVEKNPARLATKRVYKEYFQTMRDVEVAGRRYDAVGNMAILLEERARTVHVHMRWSDEYRDTGRCEPLRTYKNECVLDARDGVVLVSPYVNPHEKQVLEVALAEGHMAIVILTHGMTDYYQPAEWLREACANGQVLILTPWSKEQQEDVGRREFVRLNSMADEIVEWYGGR